MEVVKMMLLFYFWLCVFCLYSTSSVTLSVVLFLLSLLVSTSIFFFVGVWYSVIFFFIFISGLLVLVFYIVSADYKPSTSFFSPNYGFLVFGGGFWFGGSENFVFFSNPSTKFFSSFEGLKMLGVCSMIFLVLWFITKMLFSKVSNLRPMF